MPPSRLLLLPAFIALLACAGLLPPEEVAEADVPGDTGEAVEPDPGVHQTGSCADYMACLESADPDEYDRVKDEYGAQGSCWETTESVMQGCDDACEEALNELIEAEGEDVCAGAIDTGSDTGSSGTCTLDAGYWLFRFGFVLDECGLAQAGENWYATVECDGGDMSIEFDALTVALSCEGSGSSYTCQYEGGGNTLMLAGNATNGGASSGGQLEVTVSGECSTFAEFDADKE